MPADPLQGVPDPHLWFGTHESASHKAERIHELTSQMEQNRTGRGPWAGSIRSPLSTNVGLQQERFHRLEEEAARTILNRSVQGQNIHPFEALGEILHIEAPARIGLSARISRPRYRSQHAPNLVRGDLDTVRRAVVQREQEIVRGVLQAGGPESPVVMPWHKRGGEAFDAILGLYDQPGIEDLDIQFAPGHQQLFISGSFDRKSRQFRHTIQMELAGTVMTEPKAASVAGGAYVAGKEAWVQKRRAVRGVVLMRHAKGTQSQKNIAVISASEAAAESVQRYIETGGVDGVNPNQVMKMFNEEMSKTMLSGFSPEAAMQHQQLRVAHIDQVGRLQWTEPEYPYPMENQRHAKPSLIVRGMQESLADLEGYDIGDGLRLSHQTVKPELLGSGTDAGMIMSPMTVGDFAPFGELYDPSRYGYYQLPQFRFMSPHGSRAMREAIEAGELPGDVQLGTQFTTPWQRANIATQQVLAHERAKMGEYAHRTSLEGTREIINKYEGVVKRLENATDKDLIAEREAAESILKKLRASLYTNVRGEPWPLGPFNVPSQTPTAKQIKARGQAFTDKGIDRTGRSNSPFPRHKPSDYVSHVTTDIGFVRGFRVDGKEITGPEAEHLYGLLFKGEEGDVLMEEKLRELLDPDVMQELNPLKEDERYAAYLAGRFGEGRRLIGEGEPALNIYTGPLKSSVTASFRGAEDGPGLIYDYRTLAKKFLGKDFGGGVEGQLGLLLQHLDSQAPSPQARSAALRRLADLLGTDVGEIVGDGPVTVRPDLVQHLENMFGLAGEESASKSKQILTRLGQEIQEISELAGVQQRRNVMLGTLQVGDTEIELLGDVALRMPFQLRANMAENLTSHSPLREGLGFDPVKGAPVTQDMLRNLRAYGLKEMDAIADYLETKVLPLNPANEALREMAIMDQVVVGGRIKTHGTIGGIDPISEVGRMILGPDFLKDHGYKSYAAAMRDAQRTIRLFGAGEAKVSPSALRNTYWDPNKQFWTQGLTLPLDHAVELSGDLGSELVSQRPGGEFVAGQLRLPAAQIFEQNLLQDTVYGHEALHAVENALETYVRTKGGRYGSDEMASSIEELYHAMNQFTKHASKDALSPRLNFSQYIGLIGASSTEELKHFQSTTRNANLKRLAGQFLDDQAGNLRALNLYEGEVSMAGFLKLAGLHHGGGEKAQRKALDKAVAQGLVRKDGDKYYADALVASYPEQGTRNVIPMQARLIDAQMSDEVMRISQATAHLAQRDTDMDNMRVIYARNKEEAEIYRKARHAVTGVTTIPYEGAYNVPYQAIDRNTNVAGGLVRAFAEGIDDEKEVGAIAQRVEKSLRPENWSSAWLDEGFLGKKLSLKFLTGPFNLYAFGIARDVVARRESLKAFTGWSTEEMAGAVRGSIDLLGAAYQVATIKKATEAEVGFYGALEGLVAQESVNDITQLGQRVNNARRLRSSAAAILGQQLYDNLGGAVPRMAAGEVFDQQAIRGLWDRAETVASGAAREEALLEMYDLLDTQSGGVLSRSLQLITAAEQMSKTDQAGGKTMLERFSKGASKRTQRVALLEMYQGVSELEGSEARTAMVLLREQINRVHLDEVGDLIETGAYDVPKPLGAKPNRAMTPVKSDKTLKEAASGIGKWFTEIPEGGMWKRVVTVGGALLIGGAIVKNAFFPDIVPGPSERMPTPNPYQDRMVTHDPMMGLPTVPTAGNGGTMPMVMPDLGSKERETHRPVQPRIGPQISIPQSAMVTRSPGMQAPPLPKMSLASEGTATRSQASEVNPYAKVDLPMRPVQQARTRPIPTKHAPEPHSFTIDEGVYTENMQEIHQHMIVEGRGTAEREIPVMSTTSHRWNSRKPEGSIMSTNVALNI